MSQPTPFLQEICAQPLGDGHYRLEIGADWAIAGNINGGFLLAAAAHSALDALPHGEALSASGHYFAPVAPGAVEFSVQQLAGTRSTSFAQVLVTQNGQPAGHFVITATDFAHVRGHDRERRQPPALPAWDDCNDVSGFGKHLPGLRKKVIIRYPESVRWWSEPNPEDSGYDCWVAHASEAAIGTCDALMFADVTPPAAFAAYGPVGWAPTVQLSVQLRGAPADNRLIASVRTRSMKQGLAEEDAELWDANGNLVALSRQLLKVRVP